MLYSSSFADPDTKGNCSTSLRRASRAEIYMPGVVVNLVAGLGEKGGHVANHKEMYKSSKVQSLVMYVCVCFLHIYSGRQVRWMYQPGSHRRKVP